jgi:hypothetical protein
MVLKMKHGACASNLMQGDCKDKTKVDNWHKIQHTGRRDVILLVMEGDVTIKTK